MTKLDAKIIILLSKNSLNVSPTARELFMHRNTIMYHIRKIWMETGKNPLDFYDLCWLLPKARATLAWEPDEQTVKALEAIGRMTHGGQS